MPASHSSIVREGRRKIGGHDTVTLISADVPPVIGSFKGVGGCERALTAAWSCGRTCGLRKPKKRPCGGGGIASVPGGVKCRRVLAWGERLRLFSLKVGDVHTDVCSHSLSLHVEIHAHLRARAYLYPCIMHTCACVPRILHACVSCDG